MATLSVHEWPIIPQSDCAKQIFPSTAAHTVAKLSASGSTDGYDSLITSLRNPESLTDEQIYQAAAAAHAAIKKMQDEYMQLDRELFILDPTYTRKSNPRRLLDPVQYRAKHEKFIQHLVHKIVKDGPGVPAAAINKGPVHRKSPSDQPQVSQTSAKSGNRPPTPLKKAAKDSLAIDMNIDYPTNLPYKRERKPCTKYQDNDEATTSVEKDPNPSPPRNMRKRARTKCEEENEELALQPKKRAKIAILEMEDVPEEQAAATGKDLKRSKAMRKVWAKRQAEGTNGRYGGAPKPRRGVRRKE